MTMDSTALVLWACDLGLRATVILAMGGLIAAGLRRGSAAVRHLVWTATVAALVALPMLMAGMPAWRALPTWAERKAVEEVERPVGMEMPMGEVTVAAGEVQVVTEGAAAATFVAPSMEAKWGWAEWVVAAWLVGVAVMVGRLVLAMGVVKRMTGRAREAAGVAGMVEECRGEFGLRRRVTVLEAEGVAPMTVGIVVARILVPLESRGWTAERWRVVLRHEMAHIARGDVLTQALAQVMRAVYWWHPLAWYACARMAGERERACDDRVLSAGLEPGAYAEELFAVARGRRREWMMGLAGSAVLPMARLSSLEGRIRAVLDGARSRRPLTWVMVLGVVMVGLAIVLPVAALRAADTATTGAGVVDPAVIMAQEAEVAIAKRQAEDMSEVEEAKAQLALKEKAVIKFEDIGSQFEKENAKLEAAIGRFKVEIAELHHVRAVTRYKQELVRLEALKNGTAQAELQIRLVAEAGDTEAAEEMMDPDDTGLKVLVKREVLLDTRGLAGAKLGTSPQGYQVIDLTFTEAGGKRIAEITRGNRGKRLAVVVDGKLISAPTIMSEISRFGQVSLGNRTTVEEARKMVAALEKAIEASKASGGTKPAAGAASGGAAIMRPKIIKTMPVTLAKDVDPGLKEMTVTFDRAMQDRSWSWTGGGDTFPQSGGAISYDASNTTCTFPVKLEAGKVYWVGINSPSNQNFKSADQVPAPRYVIVFATRSADGKPTEIPAQMLADAKAINAAAERPEPVVMRTEPAALANDVPTTLGKLTVTFDQEMVDGSWSWTGGGDTFPVSGGKISYDAGRRTCTMPVKLEAGKVYWVGINSPSNQNFKNAGGVPVRGYVMLFATAGEDGKPTAIPEEMAARAKAINAANDAVAASQKPSGLP